MHPLIRRILFSTWINNKNNFIFFSFSLRFRRGFGWKRCEVPDPARRWTRITFTRFSWYYPRWRANDLNINDPEVSFDASTRLLLGRVLVGAISRAFKKGVRSTWRWPNVFLLENFVGPDFVVSTRFRRQVRFAASGLIWLFSAFAAFGMRCVRFFFFFKPVTLEILTRRNILFFKKLLVLRQTQAIPRTKRNNGIIFLTVSR